MSAEWMEDPEAREWARRVLDDLVPMIRGSAATVSILPGPGSEADVKFAVELGLSIMLGKPIILAVPAGRRVPAKLVQVADEIVELPSEAEEFAAAQERLQAAIARVLPGDAA
jgi:hypothetical protein